MKKIIGAGILVLALLLNASQFVSGQSLINRPNVNINANCNGYVEWLPAGYNQNTDKYPILIFWHGNSQWGPGTDSSLATVRTLGPNYWINVWLDPANSWLPFPGIPDLSKMLMVSPQFVGPDVFTNPPTATQMDDVLDYACNHYRVDRSRIYIAGPSFGGAWTLEYAAAHPYRVAAIIPFAAAVWLNQPWADSIAESNLPVWMVHNLYDNVVPTAATQEWIPALNNPTAPIPAPVPAAQVTYPPVNGHWYDDTYRGMDTATNGLNKNMYKWLLQYSRANYFLGKVGSSWEDPNNWSYKMVPDETTEVIVQRGPAIVNANAICKKITLMPGVTLTVKPGFQLSIKQ